LIEILPIEEGPNPWIFLEFLSIAQSSAQMMLLLKEKLHQLRKMPIDAGF